LPKRLVASPNDASAELDTAGATNSTASGSGRVANAMRGTSIAHELCTSPESTTTSPMRCAARWSSTRGARRRIAVPAVRVRQPRRTRPRREHDLLAEQTPSGVALSRVVEPVEEPALLLGAEQRAVARRDPRGVVARRLHVARGDARVEHREVGEVAEAERPPDRGAASKSSSATRTGIHSRQRARGRAAARVPRTLGRGVRGSSAPPAPRVVRETREFVPHGDHRRAPVQLLEVGIAAVQRVARRGSPSSAGSSCAGSIAADELAP
jgi:hypothetical protein